MKKNEKLPIQWIIGIVVTLILMVHWTNPTSRNLTMYAVTHISSYHNFFQFLTNILGFETTSSLSSENPKRNNLLMPNNPGLGQMQDASRQGLPYPNALSAGNPSSMEANSSQKENNASTKLEINDTNNSGKNALNNPVSNSTNNAETNADKGTGSMDNAELNAENNPQNNSETNSTNNADINSQNNSGDNTGYYSGNGPNNSSGDNTGNNSGGSSDNNSGASHQSNQPILPTINPIPSNNQVSQSIAQQNQNINSLTALVASRQTLVIPVQQQAQMTKYQTINAQDIPPVSSSQAPSDVQQKIQSHQLTFH